MTYFKIWLPQSCGFSLLKRITHQTSEEMIVLQREELEPEELRTEPTLNVTDRVLLALRNGPVFPEDLVERVNATIGTVRNTISALRGRGLAEDTGERQGRSQQVSLTSAGKRHVAEYLSGRATTSSSSSSYRGSDDDDANRRGPTDEQRREIARLVAKGVSPD